MKFPHTFTSAYRTRALHVQVNNIEILLKSQPLFNKSNKYIIRGRISCQQRFPAGRLHKNTPCAFGKGASADMNFESVCCLKCLLNLLWIMCRLSVIMHMKLFKLGFCFQQS
jgi:hypothetical protein